MAKFVTVERTFTSASSLGQHSHFFETFLLAKFVTVDHTFADEVELDEVETKDDKDEASVVATR